MTGMILLIDYENVQKVDLSKLPSDALVRVFVGVMQKKVPTLLARQAQVLGPRLEWIQMEGQGSNALDFHIAHYLGRFVLEYPKARHVILSKDRGFDPLVKHLNGQGFRCERIGQLAALPEAVMPKAEKPVPPPKIASVKTEKSTAAKTKNAVPASAAKTLAVGSKDQMPAQDKNLKKVIDVLRKKSKSLPHRRKTLATFIAGVFQKKISETEIERIIKALVAAGVVAEANKELSYKL